MTDQDIQEMKESATTGFKIVLHSLGDDFLIRNKEEFVPIMKHLLPHCFHKHDLFSIAMPVMDLFSAYYKKTVPGYIDYARRSDVTDNCLYAYRDGIEKTLRRVEETGEHENEERVLRIFLHAVNAIEDRNLVLFFFPLMTAYVQHLLYVHDKDIEVNLPVSDDFLVKQFKEDLKKMRLRGLAGKKRSQKQAVYERIVKVAKEIGWGRFSRSEMADRILMKMEKGELDFKRSKPIIEKALKGANYPTKNRKKKIKK